MPRFGYGDSNLGSELFQKSVDPFSVKEMNGETLLNYKEGIAILTTFKIYTFNCRMYSNFLQPFNFVSRQIS